MIGIPRHAPFARPLALALPLSLALACGGEGASGSEETGESGALDDLLRLDHVQVKGTHNSYHQEPSLPFDASHEYTHRPLAEQLESQGVRAFELDVHSDGSRLEVYHIALIDDASTCASFVDCLQEIRTWSSAHPEHLPIFVWIEVKDDTGGQSIDDLAVVDEEIRAVFAAEEIYEPDDLQGEHASPRARIEAEGWPTLGEVRGQVIFVLLDSDARALAYAHGGTGLAGRAAFVRAAPEQYAQPWAVITKINDPQADAAIAEAHAAGLIIASNSCAADQSDAQCEQELAAGKRNGVHMLKDDIPAPIPERDYFLDFPDGNPARCNEVRAPAECSAAALEDLP